MPAKPMIIEQPKSFVATIGTPVTINVTATNAIGASFQWYFNGSPLPGRNSSSLNIEHFNITDAGSYYVVVQNSQGMVQSDFALLSVTDAANLYLSVHPSLTIFGTPGKTYRIEYGTELATPTTWHQAANVTLTNSPHIWVDLNAAVTPARVYRVLLQE